MKYCITLCFYLLFSHSSYADVNPVLAVGVFSSGSLENWHNKCFSGETFYRITPLDHQFVLKAESNSSASGLFKQQRIDLQQTPFLNWRWRIENRLNNPHERSKSGDDYSARIYIVVDGGLAFWNTKAINYVWASHLPVGSVWENAFAGKNAMMIALRSATDKTHTWYQEKRHIMQDLKTQFGVDIRYIDAVALMTDTDNSKGSAITYYGDIYFSKN